MHKPFIICFFKKIPAVIVRHFQISAVAFNTYFLHDAFNIHNRIQINALYQTAYIINEPVIFLTSVFILQSFLYNIFRTFSVIWFIYKSVNVSIRLHQIFTVFKYRYNYNWSKCIFTDFSYIYCKISS